MKNDIKNILYATEQISYNKSQKQIDSALLKDFKNDVYNITLSKILNMMDLYNFNYIFEHKYNIILQVIDEVNHIFIKKIEGFTITKKEDPEKKYNYDFQFIFKECQNAFDKIYNYLKKESDQQIKIDKENLKADIEYHFNNIFEELENEKITLIINILNDPSQKQKIKELINCKNNLLFNECYNELLKKYKSIFKFDLENEKEETKLQQQKNSNYSIPFIYKFSICHKLIKTYLK